MEVAHAGTIRHFRNLFLCRQGEVVQLLSCPKKSCRVEPQNYCTEGVPCRTDGGDLLFIDALTRVGHPLGVRQPCSSLMDPVIRTSIGLWVKVGRIVQEVPEPEQYPLEAVHVPVQLQLSGGLYTPDKLVRWEAMLTFPTYHTAAGVETSLQGCQANICLGAHTASFSHSREEEQTLWNRVEAVFDPLRWVDNQ